MLIGSIFKNSLYTFSIIFIAGLLILARTGITADLEIEMLDKSYSPEIIFSEAGDKIIWPKSKGHNVEFIAGPEGFSLPKRSKMNKSYEIVLKVPGIYFYVCTPHKGIGMIGLIVVENDTSNKNSISKAKAVGKSKKKLADLLAKL